MSNEPFTKTNLREVEDVAPGLGLGGAQEIRFPTGALQAERTGLALMGVNPGCRQGIAHRHDEAEEIYVIVSGSGRIKLDDAVVEVGPMDAVRIAPHVTRMLEAGPDGLEFLAVGARHDGDGATVPGDVFWAD